MACRAEPCRANFSQRRFNCFFHLLDATGLLSGGWVAAVTDGNQWLQVDMTKPYKFRKLMIQGRSDADMWVTEFTITYSNDGSVFVLYTNINGTSVNTVFFLDSVPPFSMVNVQKSEAWARLVFYIFQNH